MSDPEPRPRPRPSLSAAFSNWSTYDAPFATKLRMVHHDHEHDHEHDHGGDDLTDPD